MESGYRVLSLETGVAAICLRAADAKVKLSKSWEVEGSAVYSRYLGWSLNEDNSCCIIFFNN